MRILTITLLLLPVCLCALTTSSQKHPSKIYTPCCIHLTSADISSDIIVYGYEKSTAKGECMEAVVLQSNNGEVCADPEAEWVKTVIANLTSGALTTPSPVSLSEKHPSKIYTPCCIHLTSADISSDIIVYGYEKSTAKGECMEAVVFRSNNGDVCADPEAEWVKTVIANMTSGNL
ncbi:C-C motif chemokine 3-like 1 [Thunnus thynnus]|uniref:C-C motif chemokine 3-like 1 n=1 Tax=Thunnus thynnus TaxID=8237 RepID=UPI003528076D